MRILAYETWEDGSLVGIRNSDGGLVISSSPADLLEFLRYSSKQVIRVFWDLDSSIAVLLRVLPLPVLKQLSVFSEDLSYCGHELYYLQERLFRVGRSRYFGIKHFWSTSEPAPVTLEETQTMADELEETLISCGMPDFAKLTSPISIFEQTDLGKQVYSSIPKGYEINPSCYEAITYASRCDKREWISAYQLGHWEEGDIFDFDCRSMYPSVAADLLDMQQFEFWKSTTYGRREEGAYYGFLCGRLYLDPSAKYAHCSPIMTDLERLPGNPAGDLGNDYYLTQEELRFINRYELGEFQLSSGWFMSPLNGTRPGKPFQSIMSYLYQQRSISPLASTVMKGVANQLIGKLIETRVDGEYGELRNDIYHASILARARVKVSEFMIQKEVQQNELVVVQTDGVRLTRNVSLSGRGMGSWRCNGSQPTIVASPYKVYVGDKKPGHLTYDHVRAMIAEHPMSQYYGRSVKGRVTLKQALQQGDISKVGSLGDLPAHLDLATIGREQNRLFTKLPKTGRALLESRYLSSSIVLPG